MNRSELVDYLDGLFSGVACPEDYSRNGLQVEGNDEVATAAFAVDARMAVFQAAAEEHAEFLFCHHGLFWGDGMPRIVGLDAVHIRGLIQNGISLYGMHLPLDAHPEIGNNAGLADVLGILRTAQEPFGWIRGVYAGVVATLPERATAGALAGALSRELQSPFGVYGDEHAVVSRVAIVSGKGAGELKAAAEQGAQALITGEMGHVDGILAQELGLAVIMGGHYITETLGPKAVMAKVQERFPELRCVWIDAPTGL